MSKEFMRALQKGVAKSFKMDVFCCTVNSVDKSADTCEVTEHSSGLDITVSLRATDDKTDLPYVIYPTVGSAIRAVNDKSGREFYLLNCDSVDAVKMCGDSFSMVKDTVLKQELNSLKNYISAFKTATVAALNGIVPASGAAIDTALIGQTTGDFSKISNERIKHGE